MRLQLNTDCPGFGAFAGVALHYIKSVVRNLDPDDKQKANINFIKITVNLLLKLLVLLFTWVSDISHELLKTKSFLKLFMLQTNAISENVNRSKSGHAANCLKYLFQTSLISTFMQQLIKMIRNQSEGIWTSKDEKVLWLFSSDEQYLKPTWT